MLETRDFRGGSLPQAYSEEKMTKETRQSVLLIDDNESDLEFATTILKSMYDVTAVVFPKCREQYQGRYFDIAVIDGLNGKCFEVYEEVNAKKEDNFYRRTFYSEVCKRKRFRSKKKTYVLVR